MSHVVSANKRITIQVHTRVKFKNIQKSERECKRIHVAVNQEIDMVQGLSWCNDENGAWLMFFGMVFMSFKVSKTIFLY